MERQPAVYVLANRPYGTLYIGVTSNLPVRVWQHKQDLVQGFSSNYGVHRLVWYEMHATMYAAISREKQLKHWKRSWKIRLAREMNPHWHDLGPGIGLESEETDGPSPSQG